MNAKKLGVITKGQDGAVWGGYLFRFDHQGIGSVYRLDQLSDDPTPLSQFTLDKADKIVPHSNSVAFSHTRYHENDEFPLLYSNIYNNYAAAEEKWKGVTCVYRLERNGNRFATTLVQLIRIGFTEDPLWRSENGSDVRPYGNCAIDGKKGVYYAFTMRDEAQNTRYFAFDLPHIQAGKYDETLGINVVTLEKEDIKFFFDCPYHRYVQGACFYDGMIYSLEGFTDDQTNPPAIRRIDVNAEKQADVSCFSQMGLTVEPELIDFYSGTCYYADHHGNIYGLTF